MHQKPANHLNTPSRTIAKRVNHTGISQKERLSDNLDLVCITFSICIRIRIEENCLQHCRLEVQRDCKALMGDVDQEAIQNFIAITDTSADVARDYLAVRFYNSDDVNNVCKEATAL